MSDLPERGNIQYQGLLIHRQPKTNLVCLTDLWQAQCSPAKQRPMVWIRLDTTQALLKRLVEQTGAIPVVSQRKQKERPSQAFITEIPGLLETNTDNGYSRTYAAVELAIVYARFLSVECYEWALTTLVEGNEARAKLVDQQFEQEVKSERQKKFSRRALIAAGWAVPVILSIGMAQGAGAEVSGHSDHNDHSDSQNGSSPFSSSAQQIHARLEQEPWVSNPAIDQAIKDSGAKFQRLNDGYGDIKLDEYSFVIDQMPSGQTPESFLADLLADMNGTVNSSTFNLINEFDKATETQKIGDIFKIDIIGPDNGSVMLTEKTSNGFTFSTVETSATGTHPENGSREFGFEKNPDGSVTFYTRGVSKAYSAAQTVGDPIQKQGWQAWADGLMNTISNQGGTVRQNSFNSITSIKNNSNSDNNIHNDTHIDFHNDNVHNDTPHIDFHNDLVHSDSAHSDFVHSDGHSDLVHNDSGHSDFVHSDGHSDLVHNDSGHSDFVHSDGHSDLVHNDSGHSDFVHSDGHNDLLNRDFRF